MLLTIDKFSLSLVTVYVSVAVIIGGLKLIPLFLPIAMLWAFNVADKINILNRGRIN